MTDTDRQMIGGLVLGFLLGMATFVTFFTYANDQPILGTLGTIASTVVGCAIGQFVNRSIKSRR